MGGCVTELAGCCLMIIVLKHNYSAAYTCDAAGKSGGWRGNLFGVLIQCLSGGCHLGRVVLALANGVGTCASF